MFSVVQLYFSVFWAERHCHPQCLPGAELAFVNVLRGVSLKRGEDKQWCEPRASFQQVWDLE